MFLIIEGLDNCGKTTLINQLRKQIFYNPRTLVFHSSSPPDRNILTHMTQNEWELCHYSNLFITINKLVNEGYDVIADRFHIGATVYGKKYRGQDSDAIFNCENYTHDNTALILITDDTSNILSREDGLSIEKNINEFNETKNMFIESFSRSIIKNKLHIDLSKNGGFANTLPKVKEFLNEIK